jgi:CheY-like chemotaxis protein
MQVQRPRTEFIGALHKTLINLYDPLELRKSLLIADLVRQPSADPTAALKKLLHEAINHLMPDEKTPPAAAAWRVYELLNYRFIEHLNQKETSKALSVSIRTVQRLEPEAIQILANCIATLYHIDLVDEPERPQAAAAQSGGANQSGGATQSSGAIQGGGAIHNGGAIQNGGDFEISSQEYQSLMAYPSRLVNLDAVLLELADFVQTLNRSTSNQFIIQHPSEPVIAQIKPALLRQALLTILSGLGNRMQGGEIHLTISRHCEQSVRQPGCRAISLDGRKDCAPEELAVDTPSAVIQITAVCPTTGASPNLAEFVAAVQQLVQISGGGLEANTDQPDGLCFCIRYPLQKQYHLLVVDDNADAIRLVQKYLEGTPYTAVGVQHASRVIASIEQEQPDLVIMDVMLPDQDGWLLLAQIRQLPTLASTPVIISTILPQEFLAVPMGANGFLRKPFTPQELLSAVERVLLKARE